VTAVLRDATGRFTARTPLPTCAGCGRVLFGWGGQSWCLWPRCELVRQVVGDAGAEVGA